MITHEELLKMWEKDAGFNKAVLDDESLNIPKLHHKYLSIYLGIKSTKVALGYKLEDLRKNKELYYSGQGTADEYKEKPFDLKLKTRAGVDKHVNTDPDVVKILRRIEYSEVLLEGLSHIMTQIQWRNQHVKNAIDYMRFTSGSL